MTEDRYDINTNSDVSSWRPALTQIGMSSTWRSFMRQILPGTGLQRGSEISDDSLTISSSYFDNNYSQDFKGRHLWMMHTLSDVIGVTNKS